ncbi:apolipoprotein acyltransferase, partial [Salmonella enterica]|nr:apolipoprotein acyltransferase [Salmonella enterica]
NNSVKIRQKNILIPFIEKKGFFDKPEKITSSYLNVDKENHFSSFFSIPDLDISTFICYESLFPKYTLPPSDLTIIQSDYSQLNKGPDYYNTVFNGSILSKFSVSINRILINIQNYGGTTVIYNDWSINWDVFNRSKKEHFLTVDI